MTILPVKKKREKTDHPIQRPPSSAGSYAGAESSSRQQSTSASTSSVSGNISSTGGPVGTVPKRPRQPSSDEGGAPVNKRFSGLISPSGLLSPSASDSSSSTQPSTSSVLPRSSPPARRQRCNSADEYREQMIREDLQEAQFAEKLARRGQIIKEMVGDGACMFRAIAEQIYGDQEMHAQIRELCMNYMANNQDHFRQFIVEDYDAYIQRKREPSTHGNHVELQAISEMFARPVEVYQYSDAEELEPIQVLLPREDPTAPPAADGRLPNNRAAPDSVFYQQNPPLRLSYHSGVHYNAILAPNIPTIGVGLGLPGMVPGSADKDLMTKAMATSELEHLEETMLQDKIDMTDYQRTQADIEDQISRESLMSYLNDLGKKKAKDSDSGPSTSAQSTSSPPRPSSSTGAAPARGLYEEMLAAQSLVPDWDAYTEDDAIAQALLLSQTELLTNRPGPSSGPARSPGGPSGSGP